MQVQCPECGEIASVPSQKEGKQGRCRCGEVFVLTPLTKRAQTVFALAAPAAAGKFCQTCGTAIHLQAEICPHCGVRQAVAVGPGDPDEKHLLPAVLLLVFVGWAGVHAFYCGRIKKGVVFLLVLIPSLVFPPFALASFVMMLLDLIYLVTGKFRDGRGNLITKWVG